VSIQDLLDHSRESRRPEASAARKSAPDFSRCTDVSETPGTAPAASRDCISSRSPTPRPSAARRMSTVNSAKRPASPAPIALGASRRGAACPPPAAGDDAGDLQRRRAGSVTPTIADCFSLVRSRGQEGRRLISKAGLSSSVWCHGAADFTGNEVALAVLVREGSSTLFLDEWIVRREIIDSPPKRNWQGRMGMRPWMSFFPRSCSSNVCCGTP